MGGLVVVVIESYFIVKLWPKHCKFSGFAMCSPYQKVNIFLEFLCPHQVIDPDFHSADES